MKKQCINGSQNSKVDSSMRAEEGRGILYIYVELEFRCLVTSFCHLHALFSESLFTEALPVGLCVVLSVCIVSLFVCWSVCVYRVMCLQCVFCIVATF